MKTYTCKSLKGTFNTVQDMVHKLHAEKSLLSALIVHTKLTLKFNQASVKALLKDYAFLKKDVTGDNIFSYAVCVEDEKHPGFTDYVQFCHKNFPVKTCIPSRDPVDMLGCKILRLSLKHYFKKTLLEYEYDIKDLKKKLKTYDQEMTSLIEDLKKYTQTESCDIQVIWEQMWKYLEVEVQKIVSNGQILPDYKVLQLKALEYLKTQKIIPAPVYELLKQYDGNLCCALYKQSTGCDNCPVHILTGADCKDVWRRINTPLNNCNVHLIRNIMYMSVSHGTIVNEDVAKLLMLPQKVDQNSFKVYTNKNRVTAMKLAFEQNTKICDLFEQAGYGKRVSVSKNQKVICNVFGLGDIELTYGYIGGHDQGLEAWRITCPNYHNVIVSQDVVMIAMMAVMQILKR